MTHDAPITAKRVLCFPISALNLPNADSIQRLKLLAGPRWSPTQPGKEGNFNGERDLDKEGWIKMSEQRFGDGNLNRQALLETLQRLVAAASVSVWTYG